jgi:hypothetical protein
MSTPKQGKIIKMSDHRKTPRAVYARGAIFTVTLTLEGEHHAQCRDLTAHEAASHTLILRDVLLRGFLKDHPDACETTARDSTDVSGRTTHYILSHGGGTPAAVLAKIEVEVQYD